jgi:hypothetical protein
LLRHALGFTPAISSKPRANAEQDLAAFTQNFAAAGGTVT